MSPKTAKANVTPIRQRTQFTCMSTSMAMALQALGQTHCDEDTVNKVMGAQPMKGASWENALACAQHFGMRATLTSPCTVKQLKAWTDAGTPVLIAWNPEGREWSHASLVFDVDDDGNVWVADPNIPDPDETVRVVPKAEFYSKWFEKWPDYLVRRPAMAIEREITVDGRQVQAGKKELRSMKDRNMSRFIKNGPVRPTEKSDATHAMDKAQWQIRKDMGMAGLPGAGMGAGLHKDKTQYDRKREKNFDREGSLTQPLMTRRDYGVTAMLNTTNFQRILKMAEDLPGPVEDYVQEIQDANPDYTEGQAWATAWSIYCVAGSTQVFTSMGLVTVGDIAKRTIMSKVGHGGVTAGEIQTTLTTHRGQGMSSHVVNTGVKPVVTLTTKHGYTLTCTPDHRILALNTDTYAVEWVPAGNCAGRYLVLPTHGTWGTQVNLSGYTPTKNVHNNVFPLRRPTTMTRDLARVLGYLVAEGSVTEEGVEFSNSDPKVVDDYTRCMTALFGEAPKIIWTQPSESNRYTKPAAKARSRTRWYRDFFSNLGLAPCVANEKTVPSAILNAPKEFVTEFLRAFTEGDGFVGDAQHPNRVDLGTASKTLAGQLHLILSNLGVLATLEVNQKGYTVRVNSAPMVRKFRDVVGGGVFKIPTVTNTNGRGSEFECIPAEGIRSLHKKIANKIPGTERISLSRIKALWGVLESHGDRATLTNLRDMMDKGYLFDPVEAVCDAGEAEVFDLSVPGDESFVANGLIAHNCKYKNPGSEHCQKSPSEYFKAAAQKIAGMSKKAGYTHYWEIKAVPTPVEWASLMAVTKKILAGAKLAGIVVRGGMGTGAPSVKADGIWLNGDGTTGQDHETFNMEPVVDSNFCKTNQKPYDAVVVSILAAAKVLLGKKIEVSSDGGPSAIRRVFGGDITAKFEKGVSMTVDEVAEVVGPEFKEMNENPPPSVVKVMEEMQGKTAAKRTTHLEDPKKPGFNLCGEKSYPETKADGPRETTCFYCKSAWEKSHGGHMASERLSIDMFADILKDSKFEKGVSVPVSELPEELQDNVKDPPPAVKKLTEELKNKQASGVLAMDMFAEALKEGKFEEGKPADPTENMSEEDAAEWHRQNDEHKDEFKGASTPAQRSDDENNAVVENFFHKSAAQPQGAAQKAIMGYLESHEPGEYALTDMARTMRGMHFKSILSAAEALNKNGLVSFDGVNVSTAKASKTADMSDLWVGWVEDSEGNMARFFPPAPRGSVKRQVMKVPGAWKVMNAGSALKKDLNPDSISPQWFAKLPTSDKGELRAFLDTAPGLTVGKTAATGLYGFTKATEGACGAGVNKLQKAAKKIAANLYAKDESSPSFLSKHAAKGGSKTASMLLKAMESLGPLAQINKTAGRSGTGLYGFSEKTAKLGLTACNDLHHEAGVIAGDLFARKGADPVKVASYLASHAKKAKCPYAALLGECAPDAPTVIAKKTATDFLASGEEDEIEGNEDVLDIVSKC